jgi:hypothetical protein
MAKQTQKVEPERAAPPPAGDQEHGPAPNGADHPILPPGDGVSPAALLADPFSDLNAFRISQDFAAELGVQKMLLKVPVRRPNRQEFFRVNPDPNYALDTALIELSEDREWFLAGPEVRGAMFDECKPVRLHTVINRQGVVSLWPARLPGSDGRMNPWHSSALEIAELAKAAWMRMAADRNLGAYQAFKAAGDLPEPEWPDKSFNDLMRLAFANGYLIDSADHPVIKRLLGKS